MAEKEEWRLVILDQADSRVLLDTDGDRFRLPQIRIPQWQRIAESITCCVKECWNLNTICLFSFVGQEPTDSDPTPPRYQVLECRTNSSAPAGLRWADGAALRHEDLARPEDFKALRRALSQGATSELGPFGKRGWFDELLKWMKPYLQLCGLTPTGGFTQFNGSPTFCLIRFETDGPALWFKAVGEPNLREYDITTVLAQRHSRFLPKVIATHPEWHGWLMEEASGIQLNTAVRLDQWQAAARALASFQKESAEGVNALVQAGCRDRRAAGLVDLVDPFLEVIGDLMQRQSKTPPVVLTRQDLSTLSRTIKEACARLQTLGVPDSLGHCDFNPGNIVVAEDGCVFLDWAEAHVGFPFMTFEYLLAHLHRDQPERASWADPIRQAYADEWETVISADKLLEALRIAPLLAVLVYALNRDAWRDPGRLQEPNFARHMRSLSRRMHREAQALIDSEVPCSSY